MFIDSTIPFILTALQEENPGEEQSAVILSVVNDAQKSVYKNELIRASIRKMGTAWDKVLS